MKNYNILRESHFRRVNGCFPEKIILGYALDGDMKYFTAIMILFISGEILVEEAFHYWARDFFLNTRTEFKIGQQLSPNPILSGIRFFNSQTKAHNDFSQRLYNGETRCNSETQTMEDVGINIFQEKYTYSLLDLIHRKEI